MSNGSKKVLVFGATGEMGSRIARGCADAGHKVTGLTRGQNARHHVDLAGIELLVGDKAEQTTLQQVLGTRDFDVLIDSVPATDHVRLAHEHFAERIEHYLLCGSTGTYVPLLHCPADETHPWREKTEVNFYHQSQRDAFALDLCAQHGFPVTILRPTNIIGQGRVPLELWGGRDITYFKLMQAGKPVEIPANFTNTLLQSGCNDDLASAFVNAVDKGSEIDGEIFNISCKRAVTLEHYFNVAKGVLKSSSDAEYLSIDEILKCRPDQAGYGGLRFLIEHMCFDIGKAERILGYRPQYSCEQGLERALAWCLDQGLL